MGQKINPTSFRLQLDKNWQSRWFASKNYSQLLIDDLKLRRMTENSLGKRAGVARVDIERSANNVNVIVHTSKPGVVIGRGGSSAEELKKKLATVVGGSVQLTIEEVKKPELVAALVAENAAMQLEKRMAFRRVMRLAMENAMKSGAKGFKMSVSGRLGGAEMARKQNVSKGSIPLQTLIADIDYSQTIARTTYGVIGVKVWIFKGRKG